MPRTEYTHAHTRKHAHRFTRTHLPTHARAHPLTLPRAHFSPRVLRWGPRQRAPAPRRAAPCCTEGLGPGARGCAAAGDSEAPPSPGHSAEPPPGRAALAPALCYANSPSQLVPAACTMSARSPQPALASQSGGRAVGGGGSGTGNTLPWVGDSSLAQPGWVVTAQ